VSFISRLFGLDKEEKKESQQVRFLEEIDDKITHTMPISKEIPKEHYIIKHNGEYLIFDSKEEMPAELREGIDEIESLDSISSVYNVIVDGQRRRYGSYAEIPDDIRKVVDQKRT
jgi:hypothetical protein